MKLLLVTDVITKRPTMINLNRVDLIYQSRHLQSKAPGGVVSHDGPVTCFVLGKRVVYVLGKIEEVMRRYK
jgi:hypothetical protein